MPIHQYIPVLLVYFHHREQLDALESQAETLENNNQVIATRKKEYGTTAEQLEYIVENGVEAFITKQQQIKISNPKDNNGTD